MVRSFATHKIRHCEEISSSLWDFVTLLGQGTGVSRKAMVPECWECSPDMRGYRGRAQYQRDIRCFGNVRLEFKGVSHTAEVYLDDRLVASHYNAYTPFSVVLRDIGEGEHRLKVVVDNSFGEASALHVPNDYQTYGGITRPVVLERLGDAYLSGMHADSIFKDGQWHLKIRAQAENLSGTAFTGKVTFFLGERELASVPVRAEGNGGASVETGELPCEEVTAWCPENPALYPLTAVLTDAHEWEIDDLIDRIGFRRVEIVGKGIYLNGNRVRIKGFCRHEDHPQFGCAIPYGAMYQDLMLMKEAGANSVRTSHYPNDERFLDLCDELGILVWEENHARGLSEENMRNPNFERQCEDCIREMITAHYNHPSIYIWGILNECASHTEYGRECYRRQYELIGQLDSTRPRSSASCQFKTDICFDLPEVVSYNIYPLWYHDTPPGEYLDDLYGWVQEETEGAGKPFLITEIGAGAIYGYRTPDMVKWSEEYQEKALEEQLTAVLSREDISGVYIWQFCDCRVCDSWFSGRPRTMNNKGIWDEYRRPKLSFRTVKRIFGGL